MSKETAGRLSRTRKPSFVSTRNYQAAQGAVLIALVNEHFDITLKYPTRKTVVTLPFYYLVRISRGSDIVDVESFIEERIGLIFAQEVANGMDFQTAIRRKETHRIVEQLHYLEDIALNFGVWCETTTLLGRKGLIQNSLVAVNAPGLTLNRRAISERGHAIHVVITEMMGCVKTVHVPRNTTAVRNALFGVPSE